MGQNLDTCKILLVVVTRVDRLMLRSRVTYSEGGTHEETLHPQSKAKVMNKRQGDKVTTRQVADL